MVRHGYLGVLELAAQRYGGRVPEWLQNYVIYELSWYYTSQDVHAATASASGEVAEEFHRLAARICTYLDPSVIRSFRLRSLPATLRLILEHGYRDQSWREESWLLNRLDEEQGLLAMVQDEVYPRSSPGNPQEPSAP